MAGRSPQDPLQAPTQGTSLGKPGTRKPTRHAVHPERDTPPRQTTRTKAKGKPPTRKTLRPPAARPGQDGSPPPRPERGQRRIRNVRERSGPRRPPAPAHGGPAPAPRRSPQRSAINPSTKLCLCVNPPAEQDPHPRQRHPFQNKGAKRSGADPRAPRPGTRRPPHDAPSHRGENNPNETSLGKDENNEKAFCCTAGSCHAAQPGRDRVCDR